VNLLNHNNAVAVLSFFLNVLLQSTAVCIVALFAILCLFRHVPVYRYSICLIGLACTLLTPFVASIQTKVGHSLLTLLIPEGINGSPSLPTGGEPYISRAVASGIPSWACWWAVIALVIWAGGVSLQIVRLVAGYTAVRRLTRNLHSYAPPQWEEHRDALGQLLGCTFPPVYLSRYAASPVAVGLFQPIVL